MFGSEIELTAGAGWGQTPLEDREVDRDRPRHLPVTIPLCRVAYVDK